MRLSDYPKEGEFLCKECMRVQQGWMLYSKNRCKSCAEPWAKDWLY